MPICKWDVPHHHHLRHHSSTTSSSDSPLLILLHLQSPSPVVCINYYPNLSLIRALFQTMIIICNGMHYYHYLCVVMGSSCDQFSDSHNAPLLLVHITNPTEPNKTITTRREEENIQNKSVSKSASAGVKQWNQSTLFMTPFRNPFVCPSSHWHNMHIVNQFIVEPLSFSISFKSGTTILSNFTKLSANLKFIVTQ